MMNKNLLLVIGCLVLLVFLVSCTSGAGLGEKFSISINEEKEISDLSIVFENVSKDLRCPRSNSSDIVVDCRGMGEAITHFNIQRDNKVLDSFNLSTEGEDSNKVVDGYSVSLVDLKPYPVIDDDSKVKLNESKYSASIVINKTS